MSSTRTVEQTLTLYEQVAAAAGSAVAVAEGVAAAAASAAAAAAGAAAFAVPGVLHVYPAGEGEAPGALTFVLQVPESAGVAENLEAKVFVTVFIDVSGSMRDYFTHLQQVAQVLATAVREAKLPEGVARVVFFSDIINGQVDLAAPDGADQIKRVPLGGNTDFVPPLNIVAEALEHGDYPHHVFFMTDGDCMGWIRRADTVTALLAQRGSSLTPIAFGHNADTSLERMATPGTAVETFIDIATLNARLRETVQQLASRVTAQLPGSAGTLAVFSNGETVAGVLTTAGELAPEDEVSLANGAVVHLQLAGAALPGGSTLAVRVERHDHPLAPEARARAFEQQTASDVAGLANLLRAAQYGDEGAALALLDRADALSRRLSRGGYKPNDPRLTALQKLQELVRRALRGVQASARHELGALLGAAQGGAAGVAVGGSASGTSAAAALRRLQDAATWTATAQHGATRQKARKTAARAAERLSAHLMRNRDAVGPLVQELQVLAHQVMLPALPEQVQVSADGLHAVYNHPVADLQQLLVVNEDTDELVPVADAQLVEGGVLLTLMHAVGAGARLRVTRHVRGTPEDPVTAENSGWTGVVVVTTGPGGALSSNTATDPDNVQAASILQAPWAAHGTLQGVMDARTFLQLLRHQTPFLRQQMVPAVALPPRAARQSEAERAWAIKFGSAGAMQVLAGVTMPPLPRAPDAWAALAYSLLLAGHAQAALVLLPYHAAAMHDKRRSYRGSVPERLADVAEAAQDMPLAVVAANAEGGDGVLTNVALAVMVPAAVVLCDTTTVASAAAAPGAPDDGDGDDDPHDGDFDADDLPPPPPLRSSVRRKDRPAYGRALAAVFETARQGAADRAQIPGIVPEAFFATLHARVALALGAENDDNWVAPGGAAHVPTLAAQLDRRLATLGRNFGTGTSKNAAQLWQLLLALCRAELVAPLSVTPAAADAAYSVLVELVQEDAPRYNAYAQRRHDGWVPLARAVAGLRALLSDPDRANAVADVMARNGGWLPSDDEAAAALAGALDAAPATPDAAVRALLTPWEAVVTALLVTRTGGNTQRLRELEENGARALVYASAQAQARGLSAYWARRCLGDAPPAAQTCAERAAQALLLKLDAYLEAQGVDSVVNRVGLLRVMNVAHEAWGGNTLGDAKTAALHALLAQSRARFAANPTYGITTLHWVGGGAVLDTPEVWDMLKPVVRAAAEAAVAGGSVLALLNGAPKSALARYELLEVLEAAGIPQQRVLLLVGAPGRSASIFNSKRFNANERRRLERAAAAAGLSAQLVQALTDNKPVELRRAAAAPAPDAAVSVPLPAKEAAGTLFEAPHSVERIHFEANNRHQPQVAVAVRVVFVAGGCHLLQGINSEISRQNFDSWDASLEAQQRIYRSEILRKHDGAGRVSDAPLAPNAAEEAEAIAAEAEAVVILNEARALRDVLLRANAGFASASSL